MNLSYLNNEIRFRNIADNEIKEAKERKRKLSFALMMRGIESNFIEDHQKICPHCYMMMPLTNICDMCGYTE